MYKNVLNTHLLSKLCLKCVKMTNTYSHSFKCSFSCLLNALFCLKDFLQLLHTNGLFEECITTWFLSSLLSANAFPHLLHTWGFSFWWTFCLCLLQWLCEVKLLPHSLQLKGFSFRWTERWCLFTSEADTNFLSHWWQTCGLSPVTKYKQQNWFTSLLLDGCRVVCTGMKIMKTDKCWLHGITIGAAQARQPEFCFDWSVDHYHSTLQWP